MASSILVADDDEQVRFVIKHKLEACGYEVCEAADGREAVETLSSRSFDLAIIDILMPERDGVETIVYIRRERPEMKVIAVSAPSNDLYLETARLLGAEMAFKKPLELAQLARAVEGLLRG